MKQVFRKASLLHRERVNPKLFNTGLLHRLRLFPHSISFNPLLG